MNRPLLHNKLEVNYRVLRQGETATVWLAMTRIQWVPAWLEGEQLNWALVQELQRSHPAAKQVAVDRVTVLRREVVLQER